MTINDTLRVERMPAPVRSQVVDNLRQAILKRQFSPGQRLIERELVELTGVSRTSIREALRELAAEGLVTTIPNRGTVVASLTADEARELYQVRSVLEGLAGRLFVENATALQVRTLVKALQSVERTYNKKVPVLAAKDAFYDALFAGGGNQSLHSIASGLHARVRVLRTLSLSRPGRPAESLGELRAIVDAVLAGDADAAAQACSYHVEQAGYAGIAALGAQHEAGSAD
jgi:DNA-binding GntR family transcriptional regulator